MVCLDLVHSGRDGRHGLKGGLTVSAGVGTSDNHDGVVLSVVQAEVTDRRLEPVRVLCEPLWKVERLGERHVDDGFGDTRRTPPNELNLKPAPPSQPSSNLLHSPPRWPPSSQTRTRTAALPLGQDPAGPLPAQQQQHLLSPPTPSSARRQRPALAMAPPGSTTTMTWTRDELQAEAPTKVGVADWTSTWTTGEETCQEPRTTRRARTTRTQTSPSSCGPGCLNAARRASCDGRRTWWTVSSGVSNSRSVFASYFLVDALTDPDRSFALVLSRTARHGDPTPQGGQHERGGAFQAHAGSDGDGTSKVPRPIVPAHASSQSELDVSVSTFIFY